MRKKLLILLFIPLITLSLNIPISSGIINTGVKKAFPIEKTVAFNKIELYDPEVVLENDRINIKLNYTATIINKELKGFLYLSSDVRYDKESADLFFKDIKFEKLTIGETEYSPENNFVLKTILEASYSVIEKKSIFNARENKITKIFNIKNVTIKDNKLIIVI